MVGPSALVHLVGFITGTLLYGMLLVLVMRTAARPDRFAVATALLGIAWNVGGLGILLLGAEHRTLSAWLSAAAFSALGLLGAVVLAAASRGAAPRERLLTRAIAVTAYGGSGMAALMHLAAAVRGWTPPSSTGLILLSASVGGALMLLVLGGGARSDGRRTVWLGGLTIFAVSALHLGQVHMSEEAWLVEVVGHHASLLLVFALLHQDYRFAFADLFLKNALTLLAVVSVVIGTYALAAPFIFERAGQASPMAVGLLLGLWTATALVFPLIRHAVTRFVDAVVLERPDFDEVRDRHARLLQACRQEPVVLNETATVIRRTLTADAVTWEVAHSADAGERDVVVDTSEAPQYVLRVGTLSGGRRLLSDDRTLLRHLATATARRIDALRLDGERYERMLEEREMRSLATEAELRALRAQINPHFLFNALTTISYLIPHAPGRAVSALLRLTTILRSVLRPEGEMTTLGRECALITCYLEIEHERFESRLRFSIDVPADLQDLSIPGLIVQPLVENAVKHGISPASTGGGVTVTAVRGRDGDVRVVVRNTGLPLGAAGGTGGFGLGLRNVEQRLRHHYGGAAAFRLMRDDDGATMAELQLPASTATSSTPVLVQRRGQ